MTQTPSEAPVKPLPRNPEAAMLEMMKVIDSFRTLMIHETELLDKADANGFLSLQDQKLTIARHYQSGITQLLERRDEFRNADPALRGKLAAMQRGFHDVVEKNLQGLDRMRRGTDRLRDKIMLFARDAALKETRFAYGASGSMQDGGKVTIGVSEQA